MNIFNKPIEQIINERHSVRNYSNKIIEQNVKQEVIEYINKVENPFDIPLSFKILDQSVLKDDKIKLYSIIKNVKNYIAVKVKKQDNALEALGYSMESIVLYLTSLGIGTCWIGSFSIEQIIKYLPIQQDEMLPVILSFGYESNNVTLKEKVVQKITDKKNRKKFGEISFDGNFGTSLKYDANNVYSNAIEMVRIAPSAVNKQPWNILKENNMYHFYENKSLNYDKRIGFDIQNVDMGIAMCHFEIYLREHNIEGHFEKQEKYPVSPSNLHYITSWICE